MCIAIVLLSVFLLVIGVIMYYIGVKISNTHRPYGHKNPSLPHEDPFSPVSISDPLFVQIPEHLHGIKYKSHSHKFEQEKMNLETTTESKNDTRPIDSTDNQPINYIDEEKAIEQAVLQPHKRQTIKNWIISEVKKGIERDKYLKEQI